MSIVLLSGCADNRTNESRYDPIDLMKYEKCLEGANQATIAVLERSDKGGTYSYDKVINFCEYLKPEKK